MPSVEKLVLKMQNQPNGVILQEAEKVLKAYGYERVRQSSSHFLYRNKIGKITGLAVHGKGKVKQTYIEDILEIVKKGDETND